MNITISEARKRLPELIMKVRRNAGAKVTITVNGVEAAELRQVEKPEQAADGATRLLDLMCSLPPVESDRVDVSSNVKEHLYGQVD